MPEAQTDRQNMSKRIGGQLNQAFSAGLLTNAMVAANATLTLLKTAVSAAQTAQTSTIAIKVNKALDAGKSLGYISETHGQTTVAGLVALTEAGTTNKQSIVD